MKLIVDHIKDKPSHLAVDEPVESFAVLAGLQQDGCRFAGPVRGEIVAQREYDHLRVAGTVTVPVVLSCSRCLADYEQLLASRFTVMYRRGAPEHSGDEEETELAEQDLVSATYSGDEIDLAFEIGEQLAMELPIKPLCSEECRGLCPTCGADLNQGGCGCRPDATSFKFSALKDFKVR